MLHRPLRRRANANHLTKPSSRIQTILSGLANRLNQPISSSDPFSPRNCLCDRLRTPSSHCPHRGRFSLSTLSHPPNSIFVYSIVSFPTAIYDYIMATMLLSPPIIFFRPPPSPPPTDYNPRPTKRRCINAAAMAQTHTASTALQGIMAGVMATPPSTPTLPPRPITPIDLTTTVAPEPSAPTKRHSQWRLGGSPGSSQSPGKVQVLGGQGSTPPSRPQTPVNSSSLEEFLPQAPARVLARRDSVILTQDDDEESVALRPHWLRGLGHRDSRDTDARPVERRLFGRQRDLSPCVRPVERRWSGQLKATTEEQQKLPQPPSVRAQHAEHRRRKLAHHGRVPPDPQLDVSPCVRHVERRRPGQPKATTEEQHELPLPSSVRAQDAVLRSRKLGRLGGTPPDRPSTPPPTSRGPRS